MFCKEQFRNYLQRRSFLIRLGLLTGAIFLDSCYKKIKPGTYGITGKLSGPNAKAGHILRDRLNLKTPSSGKTIQTLIIGSGISGLSAGRWLKQHGHTDFEILELEDHKGGNSHYGQNKVSSYPLAAHYVTVANPEDQQLIDFLQEINVITHFEKGLPYYNDYYLTFDPQERLLIKGEWQEGLIPEFGVPAEDKQQIRNFLAEVEKLKNTKGKDGRFVFDIPVCNSSADGDYRKLDRISFEAYLAEKGYRSGYLLWYLNYSCKDDYGQKIDKISAWAGLHYFASRRGRAANAENNAVLTWPQGNGWLMEQLAAPLKSHIKTSLMCYQIGFKENGNVEALIYNTREGTSSSIEARQIILATPQFVNNRLLKTINRPVDYSHFQYAPWLIANITVNQLPPSKGLGLCWDNVAYNTPSVGYVNSAQQHLEQGEAKRILTYYLPLCDQEPLMARLAAYARSYEQWLEVLMTELQYIHPGIEKAIENVDFWVWGHGMISPSVNFIWSDQLDAARAPINNKLFFAHTDLSGISIFEEAFHQGIRAAEQVLKCNG